MNLNDLFERFVKEKTFLLGVTPKTIRWFRQSWNAFTRNIGAPETLDRFTLNDFVIKLRESGISPTSVNVYTCAINSFLSWLWENNQISERLRIKPLKEEQKAIPTYNETEIKAFIGWKPKKWVEWRLHALLMTLIDTGARIDIELLRLERRNVDLENLLIKLYGKGGKERYVPMSVELRKVLWKWLQKHDHGLVFPTRNGTKMLYRNAFRDLAALCKQLGISEPKFHKFRHTFATEYMRNGGGEIYLQKALGHSSLTRTRKYAQINETDLSTP